jgi:hypothetical protein
MITNSHKVFVTGKLHAGHTIGVFASIHPWPQDIHILQIKIASYGHCDTLSPNMSSARRHIHKRKMRQKAGEDTDQNNPVLLIPSWVTKKFQTSQIKAALLEPISDPEYI